MQKKTDLILPRYHFQLLCHEVTNEVIGKLPFLGDFWWQVSVLEALQEAAEAHLVQRFEKALLICLHSGCKTLKPSDMTLVR